MTAMLDGILWTVHGNASLFFHRRRSQRRKGGAGGGGKKKVDFPLSIRNVFAAIESNSLP